MKSFRLYRRRPTASPDREAAYSSEEARKTGQAFAPQRKHRARHCWLTAIPFAGMVLGSMCPSERHPAGWALAFVCFFVFMALLTTIPGLYCPGCAKDIGFKLGTYCPECGSRYTVLPDGQQGKRCQHCARPIHRAAGRGWERLYKIRFCTNCGLLLDRRGV